MKRWRWSWLSLIYEIVWNKVAGIGGDSGRILANAHARALSVDHPGADHRIMPVEARQGLQRLIDVALTAIGSFGFEHTLIVRVQLDVGALSGIQGFFCVRAQSALLKIRGQQIRMVREDLPKNRQQSLAG